MEVTSGGTVQACISDDARIRSNKIGFRTWNDSDFSSVHTLSDIVISFTNKAKTQSRQSECSERLTGTSFKLNIDLSLKATVSVYTCDVTGKHCTRTSIRIDDRDSYCNFTRVVLDNLLNFRLAHKFAVEFRAESIDVDDFFLVDLGATFNGCLEERAVVLRARDTREELININRLGFRNSTVLFRASFQQIGTPDDVIQLLVSKMSH
mmetsp:Transcript_15877/g.43922  ORF Transcript_15877/g.43922 Transcript_15877/m.43922 type:complete len:208 (+) Transcript_15877:4267-4890(+)